jgi:precorrin-2/cobalt-factor-2 C20-methyltransferase
LLTLRAVEILKKVSAVFVPKGDTGEESQALKIVAPFLSAGQRVHEFTAPMTRDRRSLDRAWESAAGEVAAVLNEGRDAAFLTLGDSTVYSTYFYLLDALRKIMPDVDVETVPGITSFSAGAALLNRALTMGQESLAVVPATRGADFLRTVLTTFENVVLLKVAPVLEEVRSILEELGRLEDAAFVCRCGMADQFVCENLALAGELPDNYFSLILVGKKKS